MFQYKNCRNCHALDGIGGRRGPDLSNVGTRLTRNQLIDQVSNGTPGGGNMPAYGKQMSPAEMTVLVDFLVSLRPEGQPPAGVCRRIARDARSSAASDAAMSPDARCFPALVAIRPVADRFATRLQPPSICAAGACLHRRDPQRWHVGRPAAFLGGLAAIFLALASPIEPFAASAAASSHAAALAADDGRAAAHLARLAAVSAASRTCPSRFERIGSRRCCAGARCETSSPFSHIRSWHGRSMSARRGSGTRRAATSWA